MNKGMSWLQKCVDGLGLTRDLAVRGGLGPFRRGSGQLEGQGNYGCHVGEADAKQM